VPSAPLGAARKRSSIQRRVYQETRLAVQKLMIELKQKGENLNHDIAALVGTGLSA
jgi:hypothetical protein